VYDVICKRSFSFATKCSDNESELVRSVTQYLAFSVYSIFHGGMQSTLGGTQCSVLLRTFSVLPNGTAVFAIWISKNRYTQDGYNCVLLILKLIVIRQGILSAHHITVSDGFVIIERTCLCTF